MILLKIFKYKVDEDDSDLGQFTKTYFDENSEDLDFGN
jgi:hypothetical protein